MTNDAFEDCLIGETPLRAEGVFEEDEGGKANGGKNE